MPLIYRGLLVVVLIIIGIFLFIKKNNILEIKEPVIDSNIKKSIDNFISEIVIDYCSEYQINYLSVRYDIGLDSDVSYVFKTKLIASLDHILAFDKISLGDKYLKEFITEKYNIEVVKDNHLVFITEVSRIEGKIKAVENVKDVLSEVDYKNLKKELNKDIEYYKNKYSNT